MIEASIIIPTKNRANYLKKDLLSLVSLNTEPSFFEILVCDNGSTDNTADVVSSIAAQNKKYQIKYFYEPTPGSMCARHCGAKQAQGNILIFTDDDLLYSPEWLNSILNGFEKNPHVEMIGGPSFPIWESEKPEWLHYLLDENSKDGFANGEYSLLNLPAYKNMAPIDPLMIWSLNLSVQRKSFFDCGGFHQCVTSKEFQYLQGDGESGFSLKFKDQQRVSMYSPDVLVYHIIPSERLTYSFLDNRFFYQGVSDSFTEIRRKHGLYKSSFSLARWFDEINKKNTFIHNLGLWGRLHLKPTDTSAVERFFWYRLYENWLAGYRYHQTCVKMSSDLLKYVLKKNYLDYQMPKFDSVRKQTI